MIIKPPLDSASVSKVLKSSKRILILGAPGSGKSYWGEWLHRKLGHSLISLDHYYWKPNWQPADLESFANVCSELAQGDCWIMEGNFGSTFEGRWARADLVIYLDPSPWLSFWRQVLRAIGMGKRVQRPKECPEWRGFKALGQLFWLTYKFRGAHGVLISKHMREKFPEVPFYRAADLAQIYQLTVNR